MKKNIVLMTANVQGGIIQFTFYLYHVLKELGYTVKVCMPFEIRDSNIEEIEEHDRVLYHKVKNVINKRPYRELANRIRAINPDYIWYCDDSVICSEIGLALKDDKIKQLLTLHDAGGYHPTQHLSLRDRILHFYLRLVNLFFYKKVYRFILLSNESQKAFSARFSRYASFSVVINLGAHVPFSCVTKPDEIDHLGGYLLFFGRIDKYKGLNELLKAYHEVETNALPLVIAGSGSLSEEEKQLLSKTSNVTLINRYIADSEMKWLFINSVAVILPYIEATQSGVIPLSYYYSKPVIISDIPGLLQFVVDGETGIVCKTHQQWVENLKKMNAEEAAKLAEGVLRYSKNNLDWNKNLERLFSIL